MSAALVGREAEVEALSRPARHESARRDRRTRRHREDGGRDRDGPKAEPVRRRRTRRRLVGPARSRHDRRRSHRRADRGAERHGWRGGALRAAQGLRRRRDPRQLRTRHRRGRGARSPAARHRSRAADPVHQPGSARRRRRGAVRARAPCALRRGRAVHPPDRRARQAPRPGRDVDDAVQELCRSLDGLPLAIELAAARTKTLSIEEITRRLDDRFNVLRDPTSRRPERRRALRATIGWSYELLFPDDQRGLWALATFTGGAPLAGVEFVLEALDVPAAAAIDVVGRLASRSLVIVEEEGGSAPVRYRLLDSIRAFALEAVGDAGLTDRALAAHAAWFADAARSSTEGVRSRRQGEFLSFARAERANIDAALAWSAAQRTAARARHRQRVRLGVGRPRRQPRRATDPGRARGRRRRRRRSRIGPTHCCSRRGSKRRRVVSSSPERTSPRRPRWPTPSTTSTSKPRCSYYLAYVVSHDGEFRVGDGAHRSQRTRSTRDWTGRGTRPRTGSSPPGPRSRPGTRSAASPRAIRCSTGSPWSTTRGSTSGARRCSASWPASSIGSTTPSSTSVAPPTTSRSLGFLQTEAYQVSSLGRAQCQAGDYESGAATLELAIEKAEATGDVRLAALARVHLGRVLRALGRVGSSAGGARSRDRVASRGGRWRAGRARRVPAGRARRRGRGPRSGGSARRDPRGGTAQRRRPRRGLRARRAGSHRRRCRRHRRRAIELCAAADRRMDVASHFITERDRVDARSVRQLA